jgi:hypothetical protein
VNWSFCDEQDIDSNPSDFEYERSYGSPNTTGTDSRGSTFGSPDSLESVPVACHGQFQPYPAHVETLCSQARFLQAVESSKYDTAASNSSVFLGFGSVEASNALNYASRFSSYGSVESAAANFVNRNHGNGEKIAVIDGTGKRPFEERNPAVSVPKSESLDSSVRFSPEKTPPQLSVQTADASKRARTPSTLSGLDTTAGSRSYRQQTSELINKLDKLLKFPTKPGSNAGSGNKAARGSGGKGRSRRPPRDLAKPRARNVVLKQAAELIWRIKCDEQVII